MISKYLEYFTPTFWEDFMETIVKRQAADSWLKLINTARASGYSDNEWCHRNNIPPSTFYYHAKLLHKSAAAFHKPADKIVTIQDVVKIPVIQDENSAVTGSLSCPVQNGDTAFHTGVAARIYAGSITVEFHNGADNTVICSIMEALRASC
jgi:hypothetical protein